ncbi:MAG: alpha/beta hydrolase [Bacilli bacterium]|nr:alpha/beta hydrolase [Bacilli bacterium]
MPTIFQINLPSGEVLRGQHWPVQNGKANFTMITGMQEYALRYDPLAQYLNSRGINVWILDAFGQGVNAPDEEDLEKWPKDAFRLTVDAIDMMDQMARQNGLPVIQGGHSMGSFMTQSRLERYPHSADKTVIIGSNGGQAGLMSFGSFVAKVITHKGNWDKPSKFLTKLGVGAYNKGIRNPRTPLDWLSYDEANVDAYLADPYLGHLPTNGFWREFLRGMAGIWKKKNLRGIASDERIYITAGEDDPVGQCGKGPRWLFDTYRNKLGIKNVEMKLYPHMRHEIHNEADKEMVWKDLGDWILR